MSPKKQTPKKEVSECYSMSWKWSNYQQQQLSVACVWPTSCNHSLTTGRKEGNVLFNDALNTFYSDHSDSERGNPLVPHGLLIAISSKGSFICTITHTTVFVTPIPWWSFHPSGHVRRCWHLEIASYQQIYYVFSTLEQVDLASQDSTFTQRWRVENPTRYQSSWRDLVPRPDAHVGDVGSRECGDRRPLCRRRLRTVCVEMLTPTAFLNSLRRVVAFTKWWRLASTTRGAKYSSVVRAFAHGAIGRRIDPSWWTHWAISRSSQCSTTGVTKAVVCVIIHIKILLLIGKRSPCGDSGFPLLLSEWFFTICLTPYNRK